jgi:hypothetical protein
LPVAAVPSSGYLRQMRVTQHGAMMIHQLSDQRCERIAESVRSLLRRRWNAYQALT